MLCHSCYIRVVIGSVAIVHLASSHLPRATKLIISHEIWTRSTKAPFWSLFKRGLRPTMHRLCLFKVLLLTPPKKTSFLARHWRTEFHLDFSMKGCFFSECISFFFHDLCLRCTPARAKQAKRPFLVLAQPPWQRWILAIFMSACYQNILKSYEWILIEYLVIVDNWTYQMWVTIFGEMIYWAEASHLHMLF